MLLFTPLTPKPTPPLELRHKLNSTLQKPPIPITPRLRGNLHRATRLHEMSIQSILSLQRLPRHIIPPFRPYIIRIHLLLHLQTRPILRNIDQ